MKESLLHLQDFHTHQQGIEIEFDSFDGKTIFKTMFNKINHN